MMKKGSKIVTYAVLMLIVGSALGIVNFTDARDVIVTDIEMFDDFDFIVSSSYVAKFGLDEPLSSYEGYEGDEIGLLNFGIDHAYGVAIFDVPIVVNQHTLDDVVAMMKELDDDLATHMYFDSPLFSQALITKLQANNYGLLDIMNIIDELEKSGKIFCEGYELFYQSEYGADHDEDQIMTLCDARPEELFIRLGLTYKLSAKDVDFLTWKIKSECREMKTCPQQDSSAHCIGTIPAFNCELRTTEATCEPVGNEACTWIDGDGDICGQQYLPVCGISTTGGVTSYANECTACGMGAQYITGGDCPEHDYAFVDLGNNEICYNDEVRAGVKLQLSNINFQIFEKAGDVFLSLNNQGAKEANAINGRFDFAQYGHQIEHEHSNKYLNNHDKGYMVISNDQGVIDASDGKIEKTGNLANLWYGLKSGNISTAPLFWLNSVLIILMVGLLSGLVITAAEKRKVAIPQ